MNRLIFQVASIASIAIIFASCNQKPDAPSAPITQNKINDTVYVQVSPEWTGFKNPSDIFVGREPFVYVADTDNNRVVMLDLAGRLVGYANGIKQPVAIAQDGLFDLLVCGSLDTTIQNKPVTIAALYRVKLSAVQHQIGIAPVSVVYSEPSHPYRRFTGVAVFPDNSYLLARVGNQNSSVIDPDNSVLHIGSDDKNPSPIATLRPIGNALNSIGGLSGISVADSRSQDFIFTQTDSTMQYKVQWLVYQSGDVTTWVQKFDPTASGVNDFLRINRFSKPEDVTTDNFGNVFVADAGKDSIMKFTSTGKEQHSFGGKMVFNQPKGVAFFDKTLYVADSGNNRIVRFRLSTDQ